MEKGGTATILTLFLDGIKEAGANVELLYIQSQESDPASDAVDDGARLLGNASRKTTCRKYTQS